MLSDEEKQKIIREMISTKGGRQKLAASMVAPIRNRVRPPLDLFPDLEVEPEDPLDGWDEDPLDL